MTIDRTGNLYVGGVGAAVTVYAPDGTRIGVFRTGDRSANATFGEDGSTLFLASGSRLLRVRTTARGVGF
jgi:gluconolactonase